MNAVIGVAQLLEATSLNSSQQHYINLLKNSGKLLLGIINDILDYAKITSGSIELEKTPFNLPNYYYLLIKFYLPTYKVKILI
jgi:signal transduction histidine kinase